MIQERQIVKAVGKQIHIEYLLCVKYAITSFQYTAWMLICHWVNFTLVNDNQPIIGDNDL